ncbi:MAG: hypothetical protein AAF648_17740, partial [Pseudomonadota bacterium]
VTPTSADLAGGASGFVWVGVSPGGGGLCRALRQEGQQAQQTTEQREERRGTVCDVRSDKHAVSLEPEGGSDKA